ncbi:MAG: hypothetical protein QGH94_15120 [Phycisphaerae bacterium]|jgi:hypothetical protein|nr:hypothetical protein [Phycisphaerae bacterium]
MAFSFFSSRKKKSPEARFWTWFEKNQDMLFSFERDTERTFNKLAGEMSKVHGDLTFEFGPDRDGVREFVISAGGMLDAFPTVELLHDSAPDLKRWMFTKFRPRRTPMTIKMDTVEIEPSDIEVAVEADGDKAGFTVFVKGYDESRKSLFDHAAFIMLDQAIGEYDMETRVGFIDIQPFERPAEYRRHSLENLPGMFDAFLES